MNSNLHDIDLIQRYLDRGLSDDEKRNLEKRLKEEPTLKTMYQEHQLLIRGIRYAHLQNKLQQLRALEKSLPEVKREGKESKQFWIQSYWKQTTAIAASIVLFAVSYVLWNRPADPAVVYAEYFEPYPNVFEPIVRGSESVTKRSEAFYAYETGDYQKAATLFAELLREKKEPGILLVLGNANLSLGNTVEARNNFITLIKDFDEFDIQAKWYLGLSYIKEGDIKSAQLILQELNDTEYAYSIKAKELLKKVE
jgi:tetratricopeptide (TPR) repeat protein